MKKYWWEVVQATEFVDGSIIIEKTKYYQGYGIADVIDMMFEDNEKRNDGYVGAKILGVKIAGLEM